MNHQKPQSRKTGHIYSSSSDESDEYTSENDSNEKNYNPKHQNNIKKQFETLKLTHREIKKDKKGNPKMEKNAPVTKQEEPEHIKIRSLRLKDKYNTYIVIDSGAQQHTTGKGMKIISKSLFPTIKMRGASKLLDYINMHASTGLAKVKTTEGWIIIQINKILHTGHDSKQEIHHESLFFIAQAR